MEVNGVAIKSLRERHHMNQADLAMACGISRSYMSQIESNQRGVRYHLAESIADELQVETDDLLPIAGLCEKCGNRVSYIH